MKQKITVRDIDVGQRLDKFLLSHLPQYSRAFLKEQIKQGNIFVYPERSREVNGITVKPSYVLQAGDEVLFTLPEQPEKILVPNPDIKLDVIYEDDNVLVIDKPAGLSVHPRMDKSLRPVSTETKNTLVSSLIAYYPELADVGDNPLVRPGLVHRLDKDTSGVMIIAKNQTAFEWLKQQFKGHLAAKKYLALVHGHLKEKEGRIKCFLKRSPDPTKQQVASYEPLLPSDEGRVGWGDEGIPNTTPSQSPPQLRGRGKAREAISDYKVIKEFKDYSFIEVAPKTGRFHQIRAQFAWLGHPVVGDTKYGGNRQKPEGLERQFLHAEELAITLPASLASLEPRRSGPTGGPNGQKKTFNASLPDDLRAILEALENK